MSIVVGVLGALIVLGCAWGIYRGWTRIGLRTTQRWGTTVWCVWVGTFLGGGGVVASLQQPAAAQVWAWVTVVTLFLAIFGGVAIWFAAQLGAISARRRDTELGVPTAPQPAWFWLPFLLSGFTLSLAAVAAVWPWVWLTVWSETIQRCAPDCSASSPGMDTRDVRLWLALIVPAAVMWALSGLVVGGRLLIRRRRIREYAALVEGIRSRERGSYEAGYSDGRHDGESAPQERLQLGITSTDNRPYVSLSLARSSALWITGGYMTSSSTRR